MDCNLTQYDKQPDEIENLGTKIIITEEGCKNWFNNRIIQSLNEFYYVTVNNISLNVSQFNIQISDLHLLDVQLTPLQLSIDEDQQQAAYENCSARGSFKYKIQQQIYPYIQVSSEALIYGELSGEISVNGYINDSCPNFIYIDSNQIHVTIQDFYLDLNLDGNEAIFIQEIVELLNNQLINVFQDVMVQFIQKCIDLEAKIVQRSTRFSLAQPDDLIWTDLRYLYLKNNHKYVEVQLPGNVCINNGTTTYNNETVAICKGWYLNNSQLITYETNDDLQYMINKYQFQGVFSNLIDNNLVNQTINNQQIKQIIVQKIVNTGIVLEIQTQQNSYQFLTEVIPSTSHLYLKVNTLKLSLKIQKQISGTQLDQNQIQNLNSFIQQYGVSYQDASYIDYDSLHQIFINEEWMLISCNLTSLQQNQNSQSI